MFKMMTWNVENLFRPGADAGPTTEPVYQAKLQGLAAMIVWARRAGHVEEPVHAVPA